MDPDVPRSPTQREVRNVPKVTKGSHVPEAHHITVNSPYRPRKTQFSMGVVRAKRKT
jgi:hypothetical protein